VLFFFSFFKLKRFNQQKKSCNFNFISILVYFFLFGFFLFKIENSFIFNAIYYSFSDIYIFTYLKKILFIFFFDVVILKIKILLMCHYQNNE